MRFGPAIDVLALSLTTACVDLGPECLFTSPPCDTRYSDASLSSLRLCGFPSSQMEWEGTWVGRMPVGQTIPLHLEGDSTRIEKLTWHVEPRHLGGRIHARVDAQGGRAVLVALTPSGDAYDVDVVRASALFKDGSTTNLPMRACSTPSRNEVGVLMVTAAASAGLPQERVNR